MEILQDRMLTVLEASRYLRLSRSQVYLMIQKKMIPHIRLSERRIVIRQSDLIAWLERQRISVN